MNESPDFKLPSRNPFSGRDVSKQTVTRLLLCAVVCVGVLLLIAAGWLLRPDTLPDQLTEGPVIESIDEALEILADSVPDAGLDEQADAEGIMPIADHRKESPDIELDALPTLGRSDSRVLESLQDMPSAPEWLSWLPADDLVRKLVAVIDNAADGDIGRSFLSLPVSGSPIEVVESGEYFEMLDSNYKRYTPFINVIRRLDVDSLVSIYKQFEPLFERAFGELGYTNRSFRTTLDRALRQASISPPPIRELKLQKMGDRYRYVDQSVEGLPAIQKLYLRIGPENALVLRRKATEIQQALQ